MKREIKREIADRYLKTVRWSGEDNCYVGTLHDLVGDCCHGDEPVGVYRELEEIALECVEHAIENGRELPEPSATVAAA